MGEADAVQHAGHGAAAARERHGEATSRAARSGRAMPIGAWLGMAIAGWLAGVAAQLQQATLWPLAGYVAVLAAALPIAALGIVAATRSWQRRRARSPAMSLGLALLAAVAAGFGWAGGLASDRLGNALDPAVEGEDLIVVGIVAGLPQFGPDGVRFTFEVEQSTRPDGGRVTLPPRLSLGWYRGWDRRAAHDDRLAELAAGQRWRFGLRLRAPHGAANPHGFDQELWLFEQGLGATGTVRDGPGSVAVRLADDVAHPIDRLRQHWRDRLLRAVDDPQAAGVLAALAVGDQQAIDRSEWDVFRATGVAHLVSISGLHVTMLGWLGAAVVDRKSVV